jgi:7-keto-8-aminopelargonate synthetase-like enzyme
VEDDVDFIVGTFSKSLGAIGGFCVSDMDDFDVMRVVCRPYMFTASLPPAVVASTVTALRRMVEATRAAQQPDGQRQAPVRRPDRHGLPHRPDGQPDRRHDHARPGGAHRHVERPAATAST